MAFKANCSRVPIEKDMNLSFEKESGKRNVYCKIYFDIKIMIPTRYFHSFECGEEWLGTNTTTNKCQVNSGEVAFVADDALLDYLHIKHQNSYTNLYRSQEDSEAKPYVLLMEEYDNRGFELIKATNNVIKQLLNSGIYQFWVDETNRLNSGIMGFIETTTNKAMKKEKENKTDKITEYIRLSMFNFDGISFICKIMVLLSNLVLGLEILVYILKMNLNTCTLAI